ncbi:dihydrolipoamide acetyltransferase family protein [candidate division KSB1 bacterium]
MPEEVRLPDLGEGIEEGEVLTILVKAGDIVKKEQPLLEMETDKAMFEVPSPSSGKILEIHFEEGQKLKVNELLVTLEPMEAAAEAEKTPEAAVPEPEPEPEKVKQQEVEIKEEPAKPSESEQVSLPIAEPESQISQDEPQQSSGSQTGDAAQVVAGPASRRRARELGIDLSKIRGSGPGGRISPEDVEKYQESGQKSIPYTQTDRDKTKPDKKKTGSTGSDDYGPVETAHFRSIRRKTAEHVLKAWNTMPHVTQFDKADITLLDSLLRKYNESHKERGIKLTMTAYAVKAVVHILQDFPQFNAELHADDEELIHKKYYNTGIAVDTERGLMVPVVKNADKLTLAEAAVEIARLAELSRSGKIEISDLRGSTFTITNLGGIGGTYFTPIINYPETAILGLSRSGLEPRVINGEIQTRLMLPYCVTYDHRVIDGADGARFTRRLAEIFEDPLQFLIDE